MPASRSRTEHWKDCLSKIHERGGSLEISVARDTVWLPSHGEEVTQPGCDVVWRVKLVRIGETEIVVEAPAAFGETVLLKPGIALIGAMTIGQNRWMFHTRTLADRPKLAARPGGSGSAYLSLAMPTNVERCTRRHFYRISTANLNLPDVQCWALLDPTSVVAAEAANRAQINEILEGRMRLSDQSGAMNEPLESILLPEVGPMFTSKLVNISGGGIGIRVNQADAAAAQQKPYLWMRVDLRPQIPAPLAVTVRAAHTHLDSTQNLYLGLAFDFAFNPDHRLFVVDQFQHYIDRLQSTQKTGQRAG